MTRFDRSPGKHSRSRPKGRANHPRLEFLEDRILLAVNPIVAENQLPGTPESVWMIQGAGDTSLQGFATDISVNHGQTESFKINDSSGASYHIDVYRMGYYAGDGARLVTTIPASQIVEQVQPAPLSDPTTGLVDAGNWSVSASWAVPANATSGIYMARLTRDDTGDGSMIYFVVRDDTGGSDILFQTSDSTWQAYNTWGGNSLYQGSSGVASDRAVKVSYNRPLTIDATTGGYGNYNSPLHAEYPMVRWLEANGYDVSYFTDVDSDRYGSLIQTHKVFMSVGHDEYWSAAQRDNVEAARDAGVNLAFFSGNESFWKTRWETSIDGSGTPYRTLVTYKESQNNAPLDPLDSSPTWTWTGTWRDNRFSPPADGGQPENAMSGTIYMDDRTSNDLGVSLNVPAADGNLRFWRNTSVANLAPGQVATLGQYVVGYEVDEDVDNGFRPAGLIDMSSTSFSTQYHVSVPWGTVVSPGDATHSITLYRAPSGALVFSAGTIQWSWGLDGDNNIGDVAPDPSMRQATVNLLADMGVQPGTLQPGLVPASKSTDATPPTSIITSPVGGANIVSGTTVTITGTATDAGGGVVAGVEVSVDGGATWHPAVGRSSWTYTWSPDQNGNATIESRAVDDSGNIETPAPGTTVSVQGPISLWSNSIVPGIITTADTNSVELGVKFRSDVNGYIEGLRFYKGAGNTGTHVGSLWTSTGTLLAQATFTNESSTGWQQVLFSTPVSISANTTYVASYHANVGEYSSDDLYFAKGGTSNGPLHALADGTDGGNGLYEYSSTSTFPVNSYRSENYYVDVVFATSIVNGAAPTVTSQTPASGATGVDLASAVTATFSEPVTAGSIVFTLTGPGGAVPASLSYNSASLTATLTPSSPLSASTTYTAAVSGATDASSDVMTPVSWSFTTSTGTTSYNNVSIWNSSTTPAVASYPDPNPYELGVKFQSNVSGYITGIRYYKGSGNTGTHVGHLWSSTGTLLATATFVNETATGWQQVNFSSPVAITANTTYVASYHTDAGDYAVDVNYFASAGVSNGPLVALANGVAGGNGVYSPGAAAFPTSSFNSNNYWVDVVFSQTLPQTATTTTLASSANPSTSGQSVTFTATVAPTSGGGVPTGQVTFMDGATTLGAGTLNASGVATFATAALAVGSHSITAVYGGDASFLTSTSTVLSQVVNQAATTATTTTLATSANPSTFGQSVTFTATVAPASGGGVPTGQVTFMDGATTLGAGTLNASGVATFASAALAAGSHSITAVYGGDASFQTSTSAALSQVVNQAATTTTLASSANPSTSGQSVTFTATVAVNAPGAGSPTGTVTFKDGTTTLGAGTLNASGVATFASAALAAGSHSITAVYGGDASFQTSTSAALSQVVNQAATAATKTTLASSVTPSTFGQSVMLTATVAPTSGGGVPTGQVTFLDGATTLGVGALNASGVATFATAALAVGSHSIKAVYGGDASFKTSTSAALKQVVNKAATTTTLASSANPSTSGQSVTFTATVAVDAPGAGSPTGTVTFKDGTTTLGVGALNASGVATFATAALAVGSHSIKAVYSGDASFKTSTSAVLKQKVSTAVVAANDSASIVQSSAPLTQPMSAPIATAVSNKALVVAGGPAGAVQSPDPLTQPLLAPIVDEAIAQWREAGIAPQSLAALLHADVRIADLAGPLLGMAGQGVVTIDQDAAGYGWFIDTAPADDSEFRTVAQGPARDRVDLLSVVAQELEHKLGLEDDEGEDVMA